MDANGLYDLLYISSEDKAPSEGLVSINGPSKVCALVITKVKVYTDPIVKTQTQPTAQFNKVC